MISGLPGARKGRSYGLRPWKVGGHESEVWRDTWVPFPAKMLPSPLNEFVLSSSEATGCDPAYMALPLIAACSQAIGSTRRVGLKNSWSEPAIVWTAIVGTSGTRKSAAIDLALRPLRAREARMLGSWEAAHREYQKAKTAYKAKLVAWGKSPDGEPPKEPEKPRPVRYLVQDTTLEALVETLRDNPRGVLLALDELARWFSSFDRYSGGRGGGLAQWLEMHGGRGMTVDRKTGDSPLIVIPHASASVTGGITLGVLRRCLRPQNFENGLAQRLLLANPPPAKREWTDDEVDSEVQAAVGDVFDRLLALDFEGAGAAGGGRKEPKILPLSAEAKGIWVGFYNESETAIAEAEEDLSAAFSKLEGYAARFALIFQMVMDPDAQVVDRVAMDRGVAVAKWFNHETERVYVLLRGDAVPDRDPDREGNLVQMIRGRGGRITPRELQRSSRSYKTAKMATAALQDLVDGGLARWTLVGAGRRGGRPSRSLELIDRQGETRPNGAAKGHPDDETSPRDPKIGVSSTSSASSGCSVSGSKAKRGSANRAAGEDPGPGDLKENASEGSDAKRDLPPASSGELGSRRSRGQRNRARAPSLEVLRDLPEVMTTRHVAIMHDISHQAARKRIRNGQCGDYSKPGGRLQILRKDYIAFLQSNKILSPPLETPKSPQQPKAGPVFRKRPLKRGRSSTKRKSGQIEIE